jgi:spermidine synthase
MLSHPNPKSVFIGGGGEGATARELLKYKDIEKIVMVDIDADVVELSKTQMKEMSAGAFEDPRVTVIIDDAKTYLEESKEHFDIIIMDIVDPLEAGPGWVLYTQEFYRDLNERFLKNEGILVTQSAAFQDISTSFGAISKTLKETFKYAVPYSSKFIGSFGGPWGFNMCTNSDNYKLLDRTTTPEEIDDRIAARIKEDTLREYDGETHRSMFNLPGFMRKFMEKETEIFSLANPIYTNQ